MFKKLSIICLCLALISSVGYSDPFEDTSVNPANSASSNDLETGDITVVETNTSRNDVDNWILTGETASGTANASDTTDVASGTANASDTTDVASSTASTDNKTTEYTVVPGDYLIKIAQNLLGDGSRWHELVELNKDRYPSLLSNPNLIYAGWVLKIPGNGSSSSSNGNSSSGNNSGSNSNSNGNNSSDSNGTVTPATPSADDSSNVSAGKAPKRAVDNPSGAPALVYQSAPSGSGINTKSAEFKDWFNSAIDTYGDWNMPAIKNQYGQTISVEMYMKAILFIESNGTHRKSDGSLVKSYCGAQGFMQLMPATASELGVDGNDPKQNLAGGCKLFQKMFSGNYGPAGKTTGVDKLMLVACSYNAGPWSKLVKGSWQDLKNTGSSVQGYGIKLKMCLGLALEEDEKTYAKNHMTNGQSVESYAANCYAHAQGYGL
ncbi:MAG: LysM peptidoglycan-binding domain-containing protein [Candidatus Riflebacteria bacterium]|nr:LysM peptidoglycan-binding domain-containing protein [Candidatus Riflebacteria bacterium]MBR4570405.1 LysM peptidoglycan-binding domain-containing protein [Candidatus Riflebacteria bacterium]